MSKYLALYFDGPMQSWGHQSKFENRYTLNYPTFSGVIGIICAAMGIERDDRDSIAKICEIDLSIKILGHQSYNSSVIEDYHTVGGGYKSSQSQFYGRKANGKPRKEAVLTRRHYLVDAKFAGIVTGEEETLNEISESLINPKWGIWLGRKSCIPTSPIYQGEFATKEAAISHIESVSNATVIRSINTVSMESDHVASLIDIPVDFKEKEYRIRFIND